MRSAHRKSAAKIIQDGDRPTARASLNPATAVSVSGTAEMWTLEAKTEVAYYRWETAEGKRPDEFTLLRRRGGAISLGGAFLSTLERVMGIRGGCSQPSNTTPSDTQGNIVPTENTRGIQPLAVLMEYIQGTPLADIEAGKVNLLPAIFRPPLDAVKMFRDLDVFHSDINDHNVVVSPSEAPTRAVLIDFGCAGVRQDGESEEEWIRNVGFFDDERLLWRVLDEKGITGNL